MCLNVYFPFDFWVAQTFLCDILPVIILPSALVWMSKCTLQCRLEAYFRLLWWIVHFVMCNGKLTWGIQKRGPSCVNYLVSLIYFWYFIDCHIDLQQSQCHMLGVCSPLLEFAHVKFWLSQLFQIEVICCKQQTCIETWSWVKSDHIWWNHEKILVDFTTPSFLLFTDHPGPYYCQFCKEERYRTLCDALRHQRVNQWCAWGHQTGPERASSVQEKDCSVHRRDTSLQQIPAGQLPYIRETVIGC